MRTQREIELLIAFLQDACDQGGPFTRAPVTARQASQSVREALLWTTGVPVERLDAMVTQQGREEAESN